MTNERDEDQAATTALDLRRPDVPTTLGELAARKGEGLEILDARVTVLASARKAGLRLTSPADWVLFKSPEEHGGQVVGYLQDAGCDRVRDVTGIEIFGISVPEKVSGADPTEFHYIVRGSGRCKMTRQVVEDMEGGRSSTDDFCNGKRGVELELLVRKAARANLDGNIVRELAGMKAVPVEELEAAWSGTHKQISQCRLGRGFGTRDERVGGRSEKAPDIEPPVCQHCGSKGVYRPAKNDRKAFYGCPNYTKHPDKKFIVDSAEWAAKQARPAPADVPQTAANRGTPPPAASGAPPSADDIFKSPASREPGQEG